MFVSSGHKSSISFSILSKAFASRYAFLLLLLSSCAQVITPGGGPKDNNPPRVVKYSPDSAQLNFNSETIELTFDEYIQLKDLNNQLIISPPFEKTPDINFKNKSLTIDLSKEKLKPNTTYSINFGNAIQDINEGNPKENFSYIFSTGDFIDSLKLKGKVKNAFDQKTEKGILAMLFLDMTDSAVFKNQPEYFAKTNSEGEFEISNIKTGEYKVVAIKDVNSNFKFDSDAESIGFYDSLVKLNYLPKRMHDTLPDLPDSLTSQKDTLKIKQDSLNKNISTKKLPSLKKAPKEKIVPIELFLESPKKIFVKKYSHSNYGKIVLTFNAGSDSLQIRNLTNDRKGVQEFFDFSKNKDTLTYWIKNYEKDSLKLEVVNGSTVIDTLEFKMLKITDALKSKKNSFKLRVINNITENQNFDLNSNIKLTFSQPISFIDTTKKIILLEDSTIYKNNSLLEFYSDSSLYGVVLGERKGLLPSDQLQPIRLKENAKYSMIIPPETFTDIFGLMNDSIKINLKTRELKYYGSLKLQINLPKAKGKYIVQLLDEKENLVRENIIEGSDTIDYTYLYPKKYKLKLIVDENANLKWDTGNYLKKLHAEKVIYNTEEINIRSNWDAEIEWNIKN
jgi:uncharacterized protein (DUF2141 family)